MCAYLAGRHAVLEAIRAGQRIRRILVHQEARASQQSLTDVLEAASRARIPVQSTARGRLDAIQPRHQGVAAEIDGFAYTPFHDLKTRVQGVGGDALVLVLDRLQDPQNVGSLLRTALAVAVTGVVIPERRAAEITPAVVRSSAGAVEHLAVSRVPNTVRALEELKALGVWIAGLDAHGGQPYDEIDLTGPLAVVVGFEGSGLSRLMRETCDLLIHLPMAGHTESLNAAVAGSIALYHVYRLRSRLNESQARRPASR